jgi:uncharacterized protein YbbK (DUF523 family)
MTEKVLISACLLGVKVRYDGGDNPQESSILDRWRAEGRLVPVCPEVAGGLSVPRPPAEIQGGEGVDVLTGSAVVQTVQGEDVSDAFLVGAQAALALVRAHDIKVAVLKERSPSCGSGRIYDGSFEHQQRNGDGVTTALLRQHGVAVFGESELASADGALRAVDG